MNHTPIYLIVASSGAILHETWNKPVDDLLVRAFTRRELAPIQGYVEVKPTLVAAWHATVPVDCGVLGQQQADVVYDREQLPWGEPEIRIRRFTLFNRNFDLDADERALLEIEICDDIVARKLDDETAPQICYMGDAA